MFLVKFNTERPVCISKYFCSTVGIWTINVLMPPDFFEV